MKNLLQIRNITLNNYATFEDTNINFQNGLNCIIGETGSGKSLILEAIQLAFGARADKKIIRKGKDSSIVELTLDVLNIDSSRNFNFYDFFESIGFPIQENQIVIKRIISQSGTSKSFLNNLHCPVNTLSEISKKFIDMVGQFENQKLLNEDYHLSLLDSFINSKHLLDYEKNFHNFEVLLSQATRLKEKSSELVQKRDYLEFQISEFAKLCPQNGEENSLKEKKENLLNRGALLNSYSLALSILREDDSSVFNNLNKILKTIDKIKSDHSTSICSKINDIKFQLEEVEDIFNNQVSSLNEIDSDDLEGILERLDQYSKLKRKYQCSSDDLNSIHEKLNLELDLLCNTETNLKNIEDQISSLENILIGFSIIISQERIEASQKLSKEITHNIQKLNMVGASAKLDVIQNNKLGKKGTDSINFLVETNNGEGFFKINEIASGGELSRILLALRRVFSIKDSISIFLFDEIEAGIGGETALKIGKMLKEVSSTGQVIVITHLPQIASFADSIKLVNKQSMRQDDGTIRTISTVENFQYDNKALYSLMAPMEQAQVESRHLS